MQSATGSGRLSWVHGTMFGGCTKGDVLSDRLRLSDVEAVTREGEVTKQCRVLHKALIRLTTGNRATLTEHHRPQKTSSQLVTKCTSQSMWQRLHRQKLSATPASHRHSCLTVHSSVSGSPQISHKRLLLLLIPSGKGVADDSASSHERQVKLRCKMRTRLTNVLVCPAESTSWRVSVFYALVVLQIPKTACGPSTCHLLGPLLGGRHAQPPKPLSISATKSRPICL
jgi:hypothetical protein